MRFRALATTFYACLGIGALVLISVSVRRPNPGPAQLEGPPAAAAARGPAAALPQPDAPANPCRNIYRTVCQKRGETRDPTGAVRPDVDGELQALRIYEQIIHEHQDWTSEQVDEELVATIYTPKRRNRMESAFRWVLRTLEKLIDEQPESTFNATEKRQLKQRLRKTQLELPPPVAVYASEPDLFTKNDIFYERTQEGKMRIRVGGAYLFTAKSWFNILFTMGHEFAHAIDPCELRAAAIRIPAYDRLGACFLRTGLIADPKSRAECGENDQLSEAFADWFAVKVVAEALKTFATEFHGQQVIGAAVNAVRDLCEQEDDGDDDELDTEYHPSPKTRIDRIFGRNPEIREILGCGPAAPPGENPTGPLGDPVAVSQYCGFE